MARKHLPLLIGAAALMISTPVLGQDAAGRVLQKVNMRAVTVGGVGSVLVGAAFVNLWTPTVVTCPGTGTCTLLIEVSSEITSLDPGAAALVRVLVDGLLANPGIPHITFATNNGAATTGWNSHTFQWIKTGVTPGNHTVTTQMAVVNAGTAFAWQRTQKINIYKP